MTEYSDLNFLLLGLLIEAVTGEPLEHYVERAVLVPARLSPYRVSRARCAANRDRAHRALAGPAGLLRGQRPERGADGRGRRACGPVLQPAQTWLATPGSGSTWASSTVCSCSGPRPCETFLTPASPKPTRLLGWERPPHRSAPTTRGIAARQGTRPPHDSAYGNLLSDQAYGHTGWTGTLLWVDPGQDLFLVLLTNRSYGARVGDSIRALRGSAGCAADAVVREAGACHSGDPGSSPRLPVLPLPVPPFRPSRYHSVQEAPCRHQRRFARRSGE